MEHMSYLETAESYDFWCALWAIGTGVGYGVYVDRPNSPVHCNWYIILCAESGVTRKSTAISSIRDILGGHCPILTGKTSPENLELYLHDSTAEGTTARAHFAVGELTTILGREGYMSTMPALLTDLYDCPPLRTSPGTLASGELIQKDVYVTFLSASSPAWLVTCINPVVIEGGFASRVIFIVDDQRKASISWPKPRPVCSYKNLRSSFESTILAAKEVGGISITEPALARFSKWYRGRASHSDPFLSSFEAREDDHTLRAAACLCINDGTLEIQTAHITAAIQLISNAKDKAASLFGGDFDRKSKLVGAIGRVRQVLLDAGGDGIAHTKLQQKVVRIINATELRLLINILHECGMIQIFDRGKGGKFYRATKVIEKFGVTSEILANLNLL